MRPLVLQSGRRNQASFARLLARQQRRAPVIPVPKESRLFEEFVVEARRASVLFGLVGAVGHQLARGWTIGLGVAADGLEAQRVRLGRCVGGGPAPEGARLGGREAVGLVEPVQQVVPELYSGCGSRH